MDSSEDNLYNHIGFGLVDANDIISDTIPLPETILQRWTTLDKDHINHSTTNLVHEYIEDSETNYFLATLFSHDLLISKELVYLGTSCNSFEDFEYFICRLLDYLCTPVVLDGDAITSIIIKELDNIFHISFGTYYSEQTDENEYSSGPRYSKQYTISKNKLINRVKTARK